MPPLKYALIFSAIGLLAACQQNDRQSGTDETPEAVQSAAPVFAFKAGQGDLPAVPAELEMLPVQITLERLGFSPGVIDGKSGESLKIAIRGFQVANELEETGGA